MELVSNTLSKVACIHLSFNGESIYYTVCAKIGMIIHLYLACVSIIIIWTKGLISGPLCGSTVCQWQSTLILPQVIII